MAVAVDLAIDCNADIKKKVIRQTNTTNRIQSISSGCSSPEEICFNFWLLAVLPSLVWPTNNQTNHLPGA